MANVKGRKKVRKPIETITPASEEEALFLEQAKAFYREMKEAGRNAPYGKCLDVVDQFAFVQGRKLIRSSLESVMQDQVEEIEKKKEPCSCGGSWRHRGYTSKTILTTIGKISLACRYHECKKCLVKKHLVGDMLGLETGYTHGARRLAVRAGTGWSFREAQKNLKDFCGLDISYNTIRELCRHETSKMAKWYRDTPENHKEFQDASGDIEFTADGTCVNTMEGWKEVKVGIFSKRAAGQPVDPDQWEKRRLPKPTPVIAFAAVEEKDKFRKRWGQWYRRLCKKGQEISVLADGAAWIWDAAQLEFGKTSGVLDIYHALEHLNTTGKLLYGMDSEEYKFWKEEGKWQILWKGGKGVIEWLEGISKSDMTEEMLKNLENLKKYYGAHELSITIMARSFDRKRASGRSV